MDIASDAPQSRYYQSQGLKLHVTDWGNASSAAIAAGARRPRSLPQLGSSGAALRADFHVVAPDLRGHGDSGWAIGSSYSLADHVYDLTGLMKLEGFEKVAIVGHSMGGMVSLTYAGAFPERVTKLVVLDGVTNFPARRVKPAALQDIADWAGDLDKFAQRKIHLYPSVADGAVRIHARNPRLTDAQAMHLATHGMKQNADGSFSWKYDPYLRAARRTGCRSTTISTCGHASPARRCWSPPAKVFCPTPRRPA